MPRRIDSNSLAIISCTSTNSRAMSFGFENSCLLFLMYNKASSSARFSISSVVNEALSIPYKLLPPFGLFRLGRADKEIIAQIRIQDNILHSRAKSTKK